MRRTGVVLGGSVLSKSLSFLTMWLMVQYFPPGEFGRFSAIDTLNGFCSGILVTGLNWWLVRGVAGSGGRAESERIARKVLRIELAYGVLAGALLLLFAPLVAERLFSKPGITPFVRLASIGVPATILVAYRSSLYQARRMFRRDAAFNVANSGLLLAGALLAVVVLRLGLVTLGAIYVLVPLAVSGSALAIPRFAARPPVDDRPAGPGRNADGGVLWLLLYSLSLWLASQVHMLVMTGARPLEELGAYSLATRIYLVTLMLTNSINVVLLPEFSSCRSRDELRLRYGRVFGMSAAGAAVAAAGIALAGPVLGLMAGDSYAAAVPLLRVLLLGTALSTLLSPPANVLFAEGRYRTLAVGGLAMALLNAAAQLILTPVHGAAAAAWIQVGSFLLMNGVFCVSAARLLSRPPAVGKGESEGGSANL